MLTAYLSDADFHHEIIITIDKLKLNTFAV